MRLLFDIHELQGLETLKILATDRQHARGLDTYDNHSHLPDQLAIPAFQDHRVDEYIAGTDDSQIVRRTREGYLHGVVRSECLQPPDWLVAAFQERTRQFRILDTIRINFEFMSKRQLEIVYDIDTSEVVERVLRSWPDKKKKVWNGGKIRTYGLHQNGDSGKLRSIEEWL